jgi:hypothetical protein
MDLQEEIFTDINAIEKVGLIEENQEFILFLGRDSAKQIKYEGKNKQEAVNESNNNTNRIIISALQSRIRGLSFANRYDATALIGHGSDGRFFNNHRLPDILLQYLNPNLNIPWGFIVEKYIEAKEFGMMRLYDAQGLPKRYCELLLFPHGCDNIYIIFTETHASIETRIKNGIKLHEKFIEIYR